MTAMHPAEAVTTLRRATLEDMGSVARLHRLAFFHAMPHMPVLHTPDEDLAFYSTVVYPSAEIWLSERSGVTIGFIAFRPAGWITFMFTPIIRAVASAAHSWRWLKRRSLPFTSGPFNAISEHAVSTSDTASESKRRQTEPTTRNGSRTSSTSGRERLFPQLSLGSSGGVSPLP